MRDAAEPSPPLIFWEMRGERLADSQGACIRRGGDVDSTLITTRALRRIGRNCIPMIPAPLPAHAPDPHCACTAGLGWAGATVYTGTRCSKELWTQNPMSRADAIKKCEDDPQCSGKSTRPGAVRRAWPLLARRRWPTFSCSAYACKMHTHGSVECRAGGRARACMWRVAARWMRWWW